MSNHTTTETPMFLIADADWLTPDIAVGGDLSADPAEAAAQARWLQRQGITDIIDCRQEYSDEDLVADVCPAIRYHHLPTDDHGGELDPDWWYRGIAIAQLVAESGGSVFVHCHMGVNRGPSLALAILFDRGIDPLAAFDLLRARRPQAFAIYATQYLELESRYEDAKVLQTFMNLEANHDDLVAAIGRIRRAESGGRYRFPLSRAHDELAAPESVDDYRVRVQRRPLPLVFRHAGADGPLQGRSVDRTADSLRALAHRPARMDQRGGLGHEDTTREHEGLRRGSMARHLSHRVLPPAGRGPGRGRRVIRNGHEGMDFLSTEECPRPKGPGGESRMTRT